MQTANLYHTLFLKVEFDRNYSGGDFSGVGEFVLLPVVAVDVAGLHRVFHQVTNLNPNKIVHYSPDDLYNATGELVTEYDRFEE